MDKKERYVKKKSVKKIFIKFWKENTKKIKRITGAFGA